MSRIDDMIRGMEDEEKGAPAGSTQADVSVAELIHADSTGKGDTAMTETFGGRSRYGREAVPDERKPGLVDRAGAFMMKKGSEIADDPGGFAKGLMKGPAEATRQISRPFFAAGIAGLSKIAELAEKLPGESEGSVNPEKKGFRQAYKELGEDKIKGATPGEQAGIDAGSFGFKTTLGGLAGGATMAGSTGLVPSLASGAAANVPFLPKVLEEDGFKGAGTDMLLNTLFDAALPFLSKGFRGLGKLTEKMGVEHLLGDLKIEKPFARKINKDFAQAKKSIGGTIADHKLEGVMGDFPELAIKARDLADAKIVAADALVDEFMSSRPGVKVSAFDMYDATREWLKGPNSPIADDQMKNVDALLQNIMQGQVDRGLILADGMVDMRQLVEIKKSLKKSKGLFAKTAAMNSEDSFKTSVYKRAFNNTLDMIDDAVPGARPLNREARDLIFVEEAAQSAASRLQNRSKGLFKGAGGLTLGAGGLVGSGVVAALTKDPILAVGVLGLAGIGMGVRKATSQGRGGSALIRLGRGLQKADVDPLKLGRIGKTPAAPDLPRGGLDIDAKFYGGKADDAAGFRGAQPRDFASEALEKTRKAGAAKIKPAQTVEMFEDQQTILRDMRREIFKDVTDKNQRALLSGKATRDKAGNLITMTDDTRRLLNQVVEGMAMEENVDIVERFRMVDIDIPEHADDVMGLIQQYDTKVAYRASDEASGKAVRGGLGALGKKLGSEGGMVGGDVLKGTRFEKLTPAIKSPDGNKVYNGLSHKSIFNEQIAKQEPQSEAVVWKAIFDDNTGEGSPIIGFIDKYGEFISRIDAETAIENMTTVSAFNRGSSPLPQLGLTAAGSLGALTAGVAATSRKGQAQAQAVTPTPKDRDRVLESMKTMTDEELRKIADIVDPPRGSRK